ncbi:hypothetical protein BE930_15245 [Escherichia coli]|nr:hypothetical protein BE930_15245 [Escherichia coli]
MDTQAKDKKWTALAAFPGGPRDQATSAFIDGNLYVFGGIGKNSEGLTQVFNDVHKYNPKTNSWVKLMSHAPMGMAGHVTFVHNGKAYVTGGVNQNIFNGYFEDLNEAGKDSTAIDKINAHYFDKKAEDYFFNKFLLSFDPSGFAPIFPDICYHLTHYKPAAADIPVASDNPAHYADAIRYNARTPLQGSLLPLTRLVWA